MDVSVRDDCKVVLHFPDYDEVYRTVLPQDFEVRKLAEKLSIHSGNVAWTAYRALANAYMGRDGWVYDIIGWKMIKTTKEYRTMEVLLA